MHKYYKVIIIVKILLFNISFYGQISEIPSDSVINESYDELFELINSNTSKDQRINYAFLFLKKAKKNYDLEYVIGGYEILTALNDDSIGIKYADSIIDITIKRPDNFNPASAYLSKAKIYFKKLNYKQALHNYLKAQEYSIEFPNTKIEYNARHGIGNLKNTIGEYESALKVNKLNIDFFKNDINDLKVDDYINSLFSTSISYLRLHVLDSVEYYNKIGTTYSKKYNRTNKLNLFKLSNGVLYSEKGDFKKSSDTIESSVALLRSNGDRANLSIAYNYLAINQIKLNNDELALLFFKKVDSLYDLTKIINLETRDSYYSLYEILGKKKDLEGQLYYLKKIIKIDSTLNTQQRDLGSYITQNFDIPNLISKKEDLIAQLKNEKSNLLFYIVSLAIILFVISFIYYFKNQKSRKKFEKLLSLVDSKSLENSTHKTIDISKEIIAEILKNLEIFENDKDFTNTKITLSSLSKKFSTNSTYLSKVINISKGKNFSRYLNELRIDYALERLRNDASFRKYTIQAIAEDVGFKSSETFSKLFKEITSFYPSFYIKEIDKKMKGAK
ncbi:helix-turn-helix transcriptional regulator [Cellulophaga baltica]|uniref:Helix-turn-helix domain-containing protein n=1 Tax=Cellulophaga baltica TaxID=76594 RepID=A0A1G7JMQ4_9FLAO|nr:helix-turn-helix transcriptional regulator [Cellulophaga baltica]SDF26193.1 Helix-turn-helix domain-containing protein [Cellulophaga baltica]